jgi:hypothetical protein
VGGACGVNVGEEECMYDCRKVRRIEATRKIKV